MSGIWTHGHRNSVEGRGRNVFKDQRWTKLWFYFWFQDFTMKFLEATEINISRWIQTIFVPVSFIFLLRIISWIQLKSDFIVSIWYQAHCLSLIKISLLDPKRSIFFYNFGATWSGAIKTIFNIRRNNW